VVESVDASRIVVKIDDNEYDESGTGVDIYNLIKLPDQIRIPVGPAPVVKTATSEAH